MLAEQMRYVMLAKLKPFHLKHKMIVVFYFYFFKYVFHSDTPSAFCFLPEAVISSALLSFPSHHMLFNLLFQP